MEAILTLHSTISCRALSRNVRGPKSISRVFRWWSYETFRLGIKLPLVSMRLPVVGGVNLVPISRACCWGGLLVMVVSHIVNLQIFIQLYSGIFGKTNMI